MASPTPARQSKWRSSPITALVACAIVVLLAVGWLTLPGHPLGHDSIASVPPDQAGEEDDCATPPTREQCYSVVIDDTTTVRYSLTYPEEWGDKGQARPPGTVAAVLYDVGGPGAAILNGDFDLEAALERVSTTYPTILVTLEEPWVTADVSEDCRAASTEYYRSARSGDTSAVTRTASKLRDRCDAQFGFTPYVYARAVADVLLRHDLSLDGFVGHSFASVRYSYLIQEGTAPDWAIVTRPFPYGVTLTELNTTTATLVDDEQVPGMEYAVASGIDVEGRSLPVTPFDYWSSALDIGHLTIDKQEAAARGLEGADTAEFAGALSDELWGRYDVDSLAPNVFAQWQEVCGAAQGPDGAPSDEGVEYILWARSAMCSADPVLAPDSATHAGWQRTWEIAQHSLCVTANKHDTVTPGELIHKYFAHATIVDVTDPSHADVTGLDACQAHFASLISPAEEDDAPEPGGG